MRSTILTLFVLAAAALGFWFGRLGEPTPMAPPSAASDTTTWTCPMHPQVRLPENVPCPICGMDLVPLDEAGEGAENEIVLGERARVLARVETSPVERAPALRPVRMVGKLTYDETLRRTISAWVPGRLERLYVDYTGLPVQAGDHLIELYSPELLTAQEELLTARARLDRTDEERSEFLRESDRRSYDAARQKLLLQGLTDAQLDAIVERGTASDRVTIHSPLSGTVIQKHLDQGAYVRTGTPVYEIADLGHLWVQLEAYEQDLAWLAYGQEVTLHVEALPGEHFRGQVIFVDPLVHERTRTTRVRVHLENPEGRLKPGMYVRAEVEARLGSDGRLVTPALTGKWVSPMHPEVVAEGPGTCSVCGMDLVPAEELGLARSGAGGDPLVVPASAVLLTGKRAVVYVELTEREEPTYEGREVRLGPRAGEHYVVLGGLEEGERVVTHGAFRIDSAMQIRARPSMMSMPASDLGGEEEPGSAQARAELAPVVAAYLDLAEALADDDLERSRSAASTLEAALEGLDPGAREEPWASEVPRLVPAAHAAHGAEDLESLREAFLPLSNAILALTDAYGAAGAGTTYRVAHCPMAADGEGASWLQTAERLANPYYGDAMLRCGTFEATFQGRE